MRDERFEEIVIQILSKNGMNCVRTDGDDSDLVVEHRSVRYCLMVKSSRHAVFKSQAVVPAAQAMVKRAKEHGWYPVVVIGGSIEPGIRAELLGSSMWMTVVDIENLLFLAGADRNLYDRLIAELDYSAQDLLPRAIEFADPRWMTSAGGGRLEDIHGGKTASKELSNRLPFGTSDRAIEGGEYFFGLDCDGDGIADRKDMDTLRVITGRASTGKSSFLLHTIMGHLKSNEDLRAEVGQWICGKGTSSSQYEKLCTRTLMRLFAEDLTLWREQARSDAGLFRFDLICKIRRESNKDFWEMAERYFNSKYVIFEFKNYSDKVTQKEIFTTVRYLYTKALRGIAIIVSPHGTDTNANKAIRGVLRDEGKLIISLTNDELVRMLQMKEDGEEPTDYLSDKLDELLIDLEK